MQQLALWEQPEEQTEQLEQQRFTMEDIIVLSAYWADGDTSPEQLERLAVLMLGDLETAAIVRSDGVKVFYRIISTAVVDGEVLCAHEYLCTAREFYGGKESNTPDPDEEDEL